jgi:hypothetical protein
MVTYKIARIPQTRVKTTTDSWSVVQAILDAYGTASFEILEAATRQHDHPLKGDGFIKYCIKSGWLVEA